MGATPITSSLAALPYGGEPLPRRHTLSREAVLQSQRGRIEHAVLRAVAAKGYHNTTIADIVERAAVSRQTFYQHYESKEACFQAAYTQAGELVRDHIGPALEEAIGGPWRDTVRAMFHSYLELLASEPDATWSMLVEVFAAGPAFVARGADFKKMFGDVFRMLNYLAREQEPQLPVVPDALYPVLVGGVIDRIRDCLYTGDAAALTELEEPLSIVVFTVFGAS